MPSIMLLANIWNMKTHKKGLWLFFQFGHSEKKKAQKDFKPVLNWITVRYAPASNLSFNFLNHIFAGMVSYMSISGVTQLSSPQMAAENRNLCSRLLSVWICPGLWVTLKNNSHYPFHLAWCVITPYHTLRASRGHSIFLVTSTYLRSSKGLCSQRNNYLSKDHFFFFI